MRYINVNIDDYLEKIDRSKKHIENYYMQAINIVNPLVDVTSFWNDANTTSFMEYASKDKEGIASHLEDVMGNFDKLSSFLNDLSSVIKKDLGVSSVKKVSINGSGFESSYRYLDNINNSIKKTKNLVESIQYPDDFEYQSYLRNMISDNICNKVTNEKEKIKKLGNDIDDLIESNKYSIVASKEKEMNTGLISVSYNENKE